MSELIKDEGEGRETGTADNTSIMLVDLDKIVG